MVGNVTMPRAMNGAYTGGILMSSEKKKQSCCLGAQAANLLALAFQYKHAIM
jgi:hypothetical protein